MRTFVLRFAWVLAALTVAAFFLPWVKLETAAFNRVVQRERIAHQLEADAEQPAWVRYLGLRSQDARVALDAPLRGESGFSFVQWARPTAPVFDRRRALGIAEAFGVKDVRLASLIAYAVPALAVLGAALFTLDLATRIPLMLVAVASMGLYVLVRYGLDQSFLDRTVQGVSPGLGLWISLYGLGIGGLVLFLSSLSGASTR